MKDDYTQLLNETTKDLSTVVRDMVRIRKDDLSDWGNLKNTYVLGRRSSRIPASSTDVLKTDKENDVVTDIAGGFEYKLVISSGKLEWRRVALGSF